MQLPHDDEVMLWRKFKDGDRDAFATIYQQHIIPLIAYGSKLCPDDDQLKDQIQELFVELWHSRCNLSDTDSVRYYLLKALRYKLIRLEKGRQSRTFFKDLEDQDPNIVSESPVETAIVEKETFEYHKAQLKDALCHLTARQQEIIQLRFYQGLTHTQIAGLMDMNYQSVSNLLHKALARLKEYIRSSILVLVLFILVLS
jgi:RNA polymerase sigma-70 factor (ECF subfamily)